MSVTLTITNGPEITKPCLSCEDARFYGEATPEGRCCASCSGTEVHPVHQVNFSNHNAKAVLGLLGFKGDARIMGSLSCKEIPALRRKVVEAMNGDLSDLTEEPYRIPGGWAGTRIEQGGIQRMGAEVVFFGNTDEDTLRRLTLIDGLLSAAQKLGLGVSWS